MKALDTKENIVKQTCKELGFTYKQLAEKIGYGEGALKRAASTNDVSEPMKKAIELYLKNLELEEALVDLKNLELEETLADLKNFKVKTIFTDLKAIAKIIKKYF